MLDRLQVVETDSFDHKQQAQIAMQHLVPQILLERGVPEGKVGFTNEALLELAQTAEQGGVRAIRSALEQCISKVALWIDTQDADFLAPLRAADLTKTEAGALVKGGLARLLAEGGARAQGPPAGMYA